MLFEKGDTKSGDTWMCSERAGQGWSISTIRVNGGTYSTDMNAKQPESWITQILSAHSFSRIKREWYHDTDENITAVSLEKSPHGGQYYIDLGASPRKLLTVERPREYESHFRVRLEQIVPHGNELLKALDLEDSSMPLDRRKRVVEDAIAQYAIPLLRELQTLDGMARLMSSHPRAKAFMIRPGLRQFLQSTGK